MTPIYIDAFISPMRDASAEVATVGVLLLIALDVLMGLGEALWHHDYSSTKMREGIGHKCGELGFMLVGLIADGMLLGGVDLGFSPLYLVACTMLSIMEIGSVLEICVRWNPDLAKLQAFQMLRAVRERLVFDGAADLPDEVQERADRRDYGDEESL